MSVKIKCKNECEIFLETLFEKDFIRRLQVVQKIWGFSPSILTIFIDFLYFLTLPYWKKTNNASIKHTLSAFFYI